MEPVTWVQGTPATRLYVAVSKGAPTSNQYPLAANNIAPYKNVTIHMSHCAQPIILAIVRMLLPRPTGLSTATLANRAIHCRAQGQLSRIFQVPAHPVEDVAISNLGFRVGESK